jgi:hypothetical protein
MGEVIIMGGKIYQQYKRYILPLIIVLGLFIISVAALSSSVFRVTSASPESGSTITTLTRTVVISFNKELAGFDRATQLKVASSIVAGSKVEGKDLYLQLNNMNSGSNYSFKLVNIVATDGSSIDEYKYEFSYNYDPGATTEDVKVKGSDPAIKFLPVTTSQYYINYQLLDEPTPEGKTEKITIALLLTNDQALNPAFLKSYKKAALEYLDSKGIDLDGYMVEYAPAEAAKY